MSVKNSLYLSIYSFSTCTFRATLIEEIDVEINHQGIIPNVSPSPSPLPPPPPPPQYQCGQETTVTYFDVTCSLQVKIVVYLDMFFTG